MLRRARTRRNEAPQSAHYGPTVPVILQINEPYLGCSADKLAQHADGAKPQCHFFQNPNYHFTEESRELDLFFLTSQV